MVEYTRRSDSTIIIDRAVQTGENIVPAGAEARKDQVVVPRGTRVNHATVAIAAAVGLPEIAVYRRQRVAILATGDEVVDINLPPAQNEIRNSNSYSLAAQVYAAGGEPVVLPIAHDDLQDLSAMLRHGLTADLLLLTGGVSMGKYDLVEQALAFFNARFFFTGVSIQPGKPVVFGEVGTGDRVVPFFGLPGNPLSTMVTFQLFVQPVIDGLSGSPARPLRFAQARLRSEFSTKTGLTRFLPGKLTGTLEQPEAEMVHWHGSGDLMAVSQANCYIVVPPDRKHFEAGETITVLLF
jgi:molybdopterin molybdotransferase